MMSTNAGCCGSWAALNSLQTALTSNEGSYTVDVSVCVYIYIYIYIILFCIYEYIHTYPYVVYCRCSTVVQISLCK